MCLRELGEYCDSINIDCDICEHKEKCNKFTEIIEDISPCGLLNLSRNMENQIVD